VSFEKFVVQYSKVKVQNSKFKVCKD